jgi:hypothetical protein
MPNVQPRNQWGFQASVQREFAFVSFGLFLPGVPQTAWSIPWEVQCNLQGTKELLRRFQKDAMNSTLSRFEYKAKALSRSLRKGRRLQDQ